MKRHLSKVTLNTFKATPPLNFILCKITIIILMLRTPLLKLILS